MKKYLLYILLSSISIAAQSQNLVPNWSFEDTIACPPGPIDLAIGWSSYRQSPDYCHSCNSSSQSVPFNQWGYQYPKTGEAYAGLITYINFVPDAREYIGIQLLQPLIVGTEYFISFYVGMAFNVETQLFGIATNKLGLRFSTIQYTAFSNPAPIDNFAHIYTDSINTDTLNWTKISGKFIADSTYNYIIIGNFFSDSLTSITYLDSTAKWSYYYIEDIKISTDSSFVNNIENYISPYIINAFPNPARDWLTIEGKEIKSIEAYDLCGRLILPKMTVSSFKTKIDISPLRHGLYFLKINTNQSSFIQKFVKH